MAPSTSGVVDMIPGAGASGGIFSYMRLGIQLLAARGRSVLLYLFATELDLNIRARLLFGAMHSTACLLLCILLVE